MQDELLVVGTYLLRVICNMDEPPLPFEFLDGQTYADCGSHTVQVRSTRSGWNKRQATILLCIFADGAMRVKPLILFKGVLAENLTRRADNISKKSQTSYSLYYCRCPRCNQPNFSPEFASRCYTPSELPPSV